jgi:hypothetical protein
VECGRADLAEVLGLDECQLGRRIQAMLCRLIVPTGHDSQPL